MNPCAYRGHRERVEAVEFRLPYRRQEREVAVYQDPVIYKIRFAQNAQKLLLPVDTLAG